jgi:hypothetical protein
VARRNSGFNHPGHSPTEIIIPKKRSTEPDATQSGCFGAAEAKNNNKIEQQRAAQNQRASSNNYNYATGKLTRL